MLVKQRIELDAQRTKSAGLHFHQLTVGADEIDHEPPDRHLKSVPRRGQYRLDGSVQRPLSQHADARHALEVKGAPGDCRRGVIDFWESREDVDACGVTPG
jgi:hypothetical protein